MTRSSIRDDTARNWAPVVALCRELEDNLAVFATQVTEHVRADQSTAYANVPRAEQEADIRGQCVLLLAGLAARRPPTAAQTDYARALGRRRAQQGLPVEALLGAYHRAYQIFWTTLSTHSRLNEPEQAPLLMELVDLLLGWLQTTSSAVVDGYAETVRARDEIRIGLGHQFLDALYAGRAAAEETESLARALGFDPDGSFQAICCPAVPSTPERLDQLRRRFRDNDGTQCTMVRGTVLVIMSQGSSEQRIVQLLDGLDRSLDGLDALASGPVAGIGLPRAGLAGAAESITDAERALSVAQTGLPSVGPGGAGVARGGRRGEVVRFSSSWLLASLLPQFDRLRPLLDSGKATNQAHLCEAVRAYADHGFSITASAGALHVHPNTVKYRLDRWQHLTGWDPRTLDGLQRSLLSIALADRQP